VSVPSRVKEYNRGREAERLALKYKKIAGSPLAFFRGTPNLFYEDWKSSPLAGLETPAVWICGDLHLENFGSYRGDNRCTYFDFNDFDEACLGPAAWDLTRLLVSVAVEAAEREWRPKRARGLCEDVLDSYAAALTSGKARWVERETAHGIVQELFQSLEVRTPQTFLAKRTELVRRRRLLRKDGVKALPLSSKRDPKLLSALVDSIGGFRFLDGARRIAGNSSLGVPRFALLVEDMAEDVFLLDLKQARPPVGLMFNPGPPQPMWESDAHRVATVQSMVQAIPLAFLRPAQFAGEWWVLRELMPSEDRVDIANASNRKFIEHVHSLGQVVAWGHLRSGGRLGSANIDALIQFGERQAWRGRIARYAVEYSRQVRSDWEAFVRSTASAPSGSAAKSAGKLADYRRT
jgi:uncharacterized protein (DUF2252 family)